MHQKIDYSHQLYNDVFQQLESHTHTYHNNTNAANHVRIAISLPKWEALSASKILDLLPHNVNSSIIRRIQLQNHIVILCSIKLPCNSKNGRCFACAGRTIQQKMGQSVLASQPINYLTALKTNKKCIRKCDSSFDCYQPLDTKTIASNNVLKLKPCNIFRIWILFSCNISRNKQEIRRNSQGM